MKAHLTLTSVEKPELVHLSFAEINHPALFDYPEYAGKLKKILRINFDNAAEYPFMQCKKFFWGDLHETLKKLPDLNFKYAVVWYDGSWPNGSEFEYELLDAIKEWNKTKWLAAGHILSREGEQPKWHPQCVVINLETYFDIGIEYLDEFNKDYPAFCQSKEHIHDDYTPLWVCGEGAMAAGVQSRLNHDIHYEEQDNLLNVLFPHAFYNNCYIYNFPESVRSQKTCCYPEDDIEQTLEWLFDYELNTRQSLEDAIEFGNTLHDDKRNLYQFKLMDSHILYVTNTESVPNKSAMGVETMIVPCSGLHQFKHMSSNIDTLKKVCWTDFSKFGLAWTKRVLTEWDGRDFDMFYHDNIHHIMDMGFPNEYFIIYDRDLMEEFIASYGSESQWLEAWDKIREIEHEFIQADLIKDWPRVIEAAGKNNCIFVQLSNIWQYEINYLNSSIIDAELAFGNIMKNLMINNNTVYFTGDTPSGIHYSYQNLRSLPGII